MTDSNPYVSPEDDSTDRRSSVPGRTAVLAIHFAILLMIIIGGSMLSRLNGPDSGSGVLESDLIGFDDFVRSFANYSFVPAMLVLLLDVPIYVAVRYFKGRPTRWTWLGWTTIAIPFVILIYYFALWPLIRIPIEI